MTMKKRKKNYDYAHEETDEIIEKENSTIEKLYVVAYYLLARKVRNYFKPYKEAEKQKRKQLKNGSISKEDYKNWRINTFLLSFDFNFLQDELANMLADFDIQALTIIKDALPNVFALNMNYSMFKIERSINLMTSFKLCDKDTVDLLLHKNPTLLPDPVPDSKLAKELLMKKKTKWNKQKINAVITQGIMRGESIDKIAKNLKTVTDMNKRSAKTNARTMTTSAENAGRQESYKRAQEMGIGLQQMWVATIDGRTRHEHRLLDGQIRPIGKPFEVEGYKIRYPADPKASPHLVYNCRCTTIGLVKGVNIDPSNLASRKTRISGMTYEQWKHEKEKK